MEALIGLFLLFAIWFTYLVDKWRSERARRIAAEDEIKDLRIENKQLNSMLLKYGQEERKEAQAPEKTAG